MSDLAMNPAIAVEQAEWKLPDRGRVGLVCLIVTEFTLFSIFVVAYLFYTGKSLSGPTPAQVLELPVWATICLLSSSLTVALAERALKLEKMAAFKLWTGVTILLGLEFLRQTALEWRHLILDWHLTIGTNLFGTTFYSLVGLHASHVVMGLLALTIVLVFALCGAIKREHAERIEVLARYWHFVDVVWVVVFTVVYIIGR